MSISYSGLALYINDEITKMVEDSNRRADAANLAFFREEIRSQLLRRTPEAVRSIVEDTITNWQEERQMLRDEMRRDRYREQMEDRDED